MKRIYVVSSASSAERVTRDLLCVPVVCVSCQGTKHSHQLTSVTMFNSDNDIYVFDVKACPRIVLDGGLIRIFQSIELIKVFHDVSKDSKLLQPYGIKIRNYFDTQVGYSVVLEQSGFPARKISLPNLCDKFQISRFDPGTEERRKMTGDVNYWSKRPMYKIMLYSCAAEVCPLEILYNELVMKMDPEMWDWFDCMSEENRMSKTQEKRIRSVKDLRRRQEFMEHIYEYPIIRLSRDDKYLLSHTVPETQNID